MFFMEDARGIWAGMAAFLRGLTQLLPSPPSAVLVISAHWETPRFAFTGAEHPSLRYDYHGFSDNTYDLRYDVPGFPKLAEEAAALLIEAGLDASVDPVRGLDHGVFVPLKVALPDAAVPVVQMSSITRSPPNCTSLPGVHYRCATMAC